jgi:hypothetical protein
MPTPISCDDSLLLPATTLLHRTRLPLYNAALNFAAIFHLPRNREEEPVK